MKTKVKPAAKTLAEMKPTILAVAQKYGATNVRVFGSYARNEQTGDSDLDLLVDMPKDASLFDLVGLQLDLQEDLQLTIDLLTYNGINKHLKPYILADLKTL